MDNSLFPFHMCLCQEWNKAEGTAWNALRLLASDASLSWLWNAWMIMPIRRLPSAQTAGIKEKFSLHERKMIILIEFSNQASVAFSFCLFTYHINEQVNPPHDITFIMHEFCMLNFHSSTFKIWSWMMPGTGDDIIKVLQKEKTDQ